MVSDLIDLLDEFEYSIVDRESAQERGTNADIKEAQSRIDVLRLEILDRFG